VKEPSDKPRQGRGSAENGQTGIDEGDRRSSARVSRLAGISIPSAFAVLRSITSSKRSGCSPLRWWSLRLFWSLKVYQPQPVGRVVVMAIPLLAMQLHVMGT
jgi:hypothetical protein